MKDFGGAVLVARNGKILLKKGYGLANYELGVANTPDTKFQIASVTKTFTTGAILMLQEQGGLSLKDSLSKVLPDFPNGDKIKIFHLLAGLNTTRRMLILSGRITTSAFWGLIVNQRCHWVE